MSKAETHIEHQQPIHSINDVSVVSIGMLFRFEQIPGEDFYVQIVDIRLHKKAGNVQSANFPQPQITYRVNEVSEGVMVNTYLSEKPLNVFIAMLQTYRNTYLPE